MENTILKFELIRNGENEFTVDPRSVFLNGYFHWFMLNDFLFEGKVSCLSDIGEDMEIGSCHGFELEIWEDSDDYSEWIDYKIISSEPTLPIDRVNGFK